MDLQNLTLQELRALETELAQKITQYHNVQWTLKITLNSAYGAIGNEYCRWFDVRQAEAVTLSGQLSLRWIERALNAYFNERLGTLGADYIIAGDTDSVYINMKPWLLKRFAGCIPTNKNEVADVLDAVCSGELQDFINTSYQSLASYMHAFKQKMIMKREVIADKAVWAATKRYIISVLDSEGTRLVDPEMKVQGLEIVRSSTPEAARKILKKAFETVLWGNEEALIQHVQASLIEWLALPAEDIATPVSINSLEGGVTTFAKGSLLYNKLLDSHNVATKYQRITNGMKIKYVSLLPQNAFAVKCIAFVDQLPPEFNLHKLVDYYGQFDKVVTRPLQLLLSAVGWDTERKPKLSDDLFE